MLRLLRMADVELKDVMAPVDTRKRNLGSRGLSNIITDQVFKFWRQNRELEVEFDICPDPANPGHALPEGLELHGVHTGHLTVTRFCVRSMM